MQLSFTKKKNIRKNFGKLKEGLSIPNLIEVQKTHTKNLQNLSLILIINLLKVSIEFLKVFFQSRI